MFYQNYSLLKCPFCPGYNEDEYHVIINCPFYDDLRYACLSLSCNVNINFRELSMYKIMFNQNHHKSLAKYLIELFEMRS